MPTAATSDRRPLLLPTDASFQAYEGFVPTGGAQAGESWVRAELSSAAATKKRARADGGGEASATATAERRSMVSVVVAGSSSIHQQQQQQQQHQAHAVARELAALTGAPFCCADHAAAAPAAPVAPPPPSFPPPPLRFLAALARQMDEAGAWPLLVRAPGPDNDDDEGDRHGQAKQQQQQGRAPAAAATAWRLELALRDRRGRAHAALVRLDPRAFPGAPPFLARPLALPIAGGGGDGGAGGGAAAGAAAATRAATRSGAPRTLSQLVALARASVAACEPTWDALDDLDAHCWVLDPPAPQGAAVATTAETEAPPAPPPPPPRGGLCCRYRRIALGGHASLHVELAPAVVAVASPATAALPAPPRVSVLGGGAAVAELQRRWAAFDAARGWARCEGRVRPWLEAGLGVKLPPPPPPPSAAEEDEGRGGTTAAAATAPKQLLPDRVEADCAICFAYLLPAEAGTNAPEEVPTIACARGSGGGGQQGAATAAADPAAAPAGCGRAFHRRCISEWLQALPSTARCFGGLRGECPYCGAEVEVGAAD
jgi:hypothetical protein